MVVGAKVLRQIWAGVTTEEVQRFDAELDRATNDLHRCRDVLDEACRQAVELDIDNAERRRDRYELEAAWSALNSALREMTRGLDPLELVAEARSVRTQSDSKLSGWRRDAVAAQLPRELLDQVGLESGGLVVECRARFLGSPPPTDPLRAADGVEDRPGAPPVAHAALADDLRARLVAARWVLDANSDNVYHKYRILRRAVIVNSIIYALVLVALVAMVAAGWAPDALLPDDPADSPLGSWRLLLVVMTLGVVGALFSSATELRRGDEETRIPQLRVRYTLMGMRVVVGPAGAVVVIVILQSVLRDAVVLESPAVFGVAIVAGFTERLVTRTVSSAANAIGPV